ncbi:MAG: 50S ribosomal protein L5 [Clostridiales bacterium]|nr:50S ribosomal protein L5 [Clostridiales bacterium]
MAEKAKKTEATAASGTPAVKTSNPDRYRLRKRYQTEIVPQLMKERGYKNVNEVPKIVKVVLNMRLGDIKDNSKSIQLAQSELDAISGQKSVLVKAKKSVSNFKLREGQSIALKTTLRGEMAYEFLDRLVSVALPRVRDFRGISGKSFDGRGNYALGIKDQTIFPEISYELIEKIRGFDVDVVTTAKTDEEAKLLLTKLGMPFKN